MQINLHEFLERTVLSHKIEKYLEIGTREGCSLKRIVTNNPHLTEVIVSDLWGPTYGGSNRNSHDHITTLLKELNFNGKITFLDGDSKQTIPTLKIHYANYFDLILVDGDHSYEGGMIDLENTWDLCRSGGIVVFDDITHPDHMYLENCFDTFVNNKRDTILSVDKIHYGCGIGIIYKK